GPPPSVRLPHRDRQRMAKAAQAAPVRLPEDLGFGQRGAQALDVRVELRLLRHQSLAEFPAAPCQPQAPDHGRHAFQNDRCDADDEQPDPNPAEVSHSLASPSSIPATGAIATTWSSGARRMTMTPCV